MNIFARRSRTSPRRGLAHAGLLSAATWFAGALGSAAGLLSPSAAMGQAIESITPYYAAVTKDGSALQCRLGSASYSVKTLKAGDVIRIDGQSGAWLQAEYPAGMSAFVKLDDCQTIEAGKAVKLTRNARLMAANADGGVNWWYIDKELPAGTTFSVTKVVKGPDGKDSGYLVPAPKGSHGFVRKDSVRQATQSEIDAATKGATDAPKPADTPKPETAPKPPASDPPKPISDIVKPPDAAPTEPSTTPTNPPGTTDNTKPPEAPATTPSTTVPPENGAAPTTPANPPPVPPPAVTRPKVDVESLSTLYLSAMTKSDSEMEMSAVIGEYDKAISDLESTPGAERLRRQLSVRRDALKLRSELQEALRASDQRLSAIRDKAKTADDAISRFEKERQFAVVGKLAASSVYDGTRLPLMYRVVSTDPIAPRTLAYVLPAPSLSLQNMIGEMVGVAGDKKYDEQLKVNVIAPTRAEVVKVPSVEVPVAPPPAPSAGAPSTVTPDGIRTEVPIRQPEK
ncbi:MAG: hypothetical protein AB7N73_15685 [Gemmatimonadales bacterium]